MATIGNINIGVNSRNNFHDFKHDVNSTLSFGFAEPTLIQSVHAKSKISLKTSSVVRLAPLPAPTFGRMKARQDTVFVPMTDVFEAWNEFITGTGYKTANSGVQNVTKVDHMSFNQLMAIMLTMGKVSGYSADTFKLEQMNNLFRQMFTIGFSTNWSPFSSPDEAYGSQWYDLDSLMLEATTRAGKRTALKYLKDFLTNCIEVKDLVSTPFYQFLKLTEGSTLDNDVLYCDDRSIFNPYSVSNNILHYFYRPSYFKNADYLSLDDSVINNLVTSYNNAPDVITSLFDMPRTHENYDFAFVYVPSNVRYFPNLESFDEDGNDTIASIPDPNNLAKVCMTFHLTPYGKRVMKIINAMGVTSRYDDIIELPKLFAYYKAWFDLYDPQRNKNWKQTTAYELIHNYYDYRSTVYDMLEDADVPFPSSFDSFYYKLEDFLVDLVKCNYYLGADTFTVANRYPLQPASGDLSSPHMLGDLGHSMYQGVNSDQDAVQTLTDAYRGYGTAGTFGTNALTSLSVIALERLYYAINKESALAANIEDIMLARFGVNIKSTRVLGRSDYNIEIDPVFATVNNDQTSLGEYGGKSVASGTSKDINFTAPVQGYVIQLFSIVPYGGYVQGSTPAQIKRDQFYSDFTAMYDSLGYEKMYKSQVLGRESVINNFGEDGEFGYVPQMFHLKYRNNLANGGFSFHSERAQFLPYSLDRLFSEGEVNNKVNLLLGSVSDTYSKPVDVVPDPIMRTVGLFEGFGNYDRIFYDTTGLSDNFILHMIQDLKYYSPMKSISNSFDTVDKSVDDDNRQAERA